MNNSTTNVSISFETVTQKTFMCMVMILISLTAIVGNFFVMNAMRIDKRLRTASNSFILSLSISDFLIGFFVMPLSALYILFDQEWIFGKVVCNIWLSIDYTASTASIFNLFALSLDRYWSISDPLKYLCRHNKKRALISILTLWLISCLWIVPINLWKYMSINQINKLFYDDNYDYFNNNNNNNSLLINVNSNYTLINNNNDSNYTIATSYYYYTDKMKCDTDFETNRPFKIITTILNFYVPLIGMTLIYMKIFITIKNRSKSEIGRFMSRKYKTSQPSKSNTTDSSQESQKTNHSKSKYLTFLKLIRKKTMNKRKEKDVAKSSSEENKMILCKDENIINNTNNSDRHNYSNHVTTTTATTSKEGNNAFKMESFSDNTKQQQQINENDYDIDFQYSYDETVFDSKSETIVRFLYHHNNCKESSSCSGVETSKHTKGSSSANTNNEVEVINKSCNITTTTTNNNNKNTNNSNNEINVSSSHLNNNNNSNNNIALSNCNNHYINDAVNNQINFEDVEDKADDNCNNSNNMNNIDNLNESTNNKNTNTNNNIFVFFVNRYSFIRNKFNNISTNRRSNKYVRKRRNGLVNITNSSKFKFKSSNTTIPTDSSANATTTTTRGGCETTTVISDNSCNGTFLNNKKGRKQIQTTLDDSVTDNEQQSDLINSTSTANSQNMVNKLNKYNNSNSTKATSHRLNKQIKAAKQLGILLGAFLVTWLPYFILFMVVAFCPHCVSDNVYITTIWLGYLNSAINPILYPLCNSSFKHAFRTMLHLPNPTYTKQHLKHILNNYTSR